MCYESTSIRCRGRRPRRSTESISAQLLLIVRSMLLDRPSLPTLTHPSDESVFAGRMRLGRWRGESSWSGGRESGRRMPDMLSWVTAGHGIATQGPTKEITRIFGIAYYILDIGSDGKFDHKYIYVMSPSRFGLEDAPLATVCLDLVLHCSVFVWLVVICR